MSNIKAQARLRTASDVEVPTPNRNPIATLSTIDIYNLVCQSWIARNRTPDSRFRLSHRPDRLFQPPKR